MVTIGIGVEAEYLLLDSLTGLPTAERPCVRAVAAALRGWPTSALPGLTDEAEVGPEQLKAQIEISTPVCDAVDEVGSELCRLQGAVHAAARVVGYEVAATGAAPARGVAVTPVGR
ncbi:glutamate-cysteine ligase family protein [Streptacidiphilus neutrinimicus]|uniref:glutamate-cysteine ligase family protein n=1 Tax=Streptacidiphilus neutrinimicus TaxID=105420 RepID=UPI0005A85D82|nr:glutamate-cysteine ligase family protein [Streptacidiphilus neutrinimicus]